MSVLITGLVIGDPKPFNLEVSRKVPNESVVETVVLKSGSIDTEFASKLPGLVTSNQLLNV
jgi:hypothetical protein